MPHEPPGENVSDAHAPATRVFQGSKAQCLEFGLVLDAKGIAYARVESDGVWSILVAPDAADGALDELTRYAAERIPYREAPAIIEPFPHSASGAAAYAVVLIVVAYCAGIQLFEVDWFAAGALQSTPGRVEWWRAFTALTLHLDQEHLLGNLLFGIGIGGLAGRMFGPGFAWLGILVAGAAANAIDLWLSPAGHRAVGASTAVFAGLGLLAGFGWGQRRKLRDRRLYRWGPLFAGVCLLALLGAGNEHVDVLGHLLGFLAGTVLGWAFARANLPPTRRIAFQVASGVSALLLICAAWLVALRH